MTMVRLCPEQSPNAAAVPHCTRCGSTEIVADAWACWDADHQCWTVKAVFEHTECKACGMAAAPSWQPVCGPVDIDGTGT
jgi:hypothetical protein